MSTSGTQRQMNINIPLVYSTYPTSLNIGSAPISDMSKLVTLRTKMGSPSSGPDHYLYFSTNREAGLYKVPSGKILKIFSIYQPGGSPTLAGTGFILGYGETPNNTTDYDQGPSPTGDVVYFALNSTSYLSLQGPLVFNASIPANRYPFVRYSSASYFNGVLAGWEI